MGEISEELVQIININQVILKRSQKAFDRLMTKELKYTKKQTKLIKNEMNTNEENLDIKIMELKLTQIQNRLKLLDQLCNERDNMLKNITSLMLQINGLI